MKNDYKNDILNGERKYLMKENADGTVSFSDKSDYAQVGDVFGADELNAFANEANQLAENVKTDADIATESAKYARQQASNASQSARSALSASGLAYQYAERAYQATPTGYQYMVNTVEETDDKINKYNINEFEVIGTQYPSMRYHIDYDIDYPANTKKMVVSATISYANYYGKKLTVNVVTNTMNQTHIYDCDMPTTDIMEIIPISEKDSYCSVRVYCDTEDAISGSTLTVKSYVYEYSVIDNLVESADSQNVHFSSDVTHELETAKGGIRIDKIEGRMHKSANLYNPSDYSDGYVNSDGSTSILTNWGHVIIPVKPNTSYTMSGTSINGTSGHIVAYNGDTILGSVGTYKNFTFTTPSNTTKIKCTIYKHDNATLMINEGSIALPYESFGLHIAGDMGYFDGQLVYGFYRDADNVLQSSGRFAVGELMPCKPGDVITHTYIDATISKYISFYDADNKRITYGDSKEDSITMTAPNGTSSYCVSYSRDSGNIWHLNADKISVTINGQYAVAVKEHGKNLFDGVGIAETNKIINADGVITANNNLQYSNAIPVKPNTRYTISFVKNVDGNDRLHEYTSNDTWIRQVSLVSALGSGLGKKEVTITTSSNCYALRFSYGMQDTDVVIAESKNVFVPTSSPLAEDDKIDENGEYHVRKKVNLEDLAWKAMSDGIRFYTVSTSSDIKLVKSADVKGYLVCDKYTLGTRNALKDMEIGEDTDGSIFIKDSSINGDTSKIKGTLVYELATPTLTPLTAEQKIALNSLESYSDKTYISTADGLATLSIAYGKSDTVATALNAERIAKLNECKLNEIYSELTNALISMNGTV